MKARMKPCRECPFRKASAPGWIGGHTSAAEITGIVLSDQKFPCHLEVERLEQQGESFETAVDEADHCTGALIFMRNTCKISRDREIAMLQGTVERSADIFETAAQMHEHHRRKQR